MDTDNIIRKNKLVKNTTSSFLLQIVILISGFILPFFRLETYGSAVNGLVSSIAQFLQIISVLELGVGSVVKSVLYIPLAKKDNNQISKILSSANKFFSRIAKMLIIYVILLILFYPLIVAESFSFLYTGVLIASMSISSVAQYYLGITNSLLLSGDQKGYVQDNIQIVTVIINLLISIFLMSANYSIQIVKLSTSLVYLLRPIILQYYVNKNYNINKSISYDVEPIKQKWNGVAQHLSAIVLDSTDIIILTLFSTLKNVSIYSVYYMVIGGVKAFTISLTNGIQSLLGELWAKNEQEELKKVFSWTEWSIHNLTMIIFGCTAVLIGPFIQVYTKDIYDTNYYQPIFGILLALAHALHSLRLPYNLLILAVGHYKQTQKSYIIAALINLVISLLAVQKFGLIGVAIGTIIALGYQTVWMVIYNYKNLLNRPFNNFTKQLLVDFLIFFVATNLTLNLNLKSLNFISWLLLASITLIIWLIISLIFNLIFYKQKIIFVIKKFKRKFI